MGDVWPQRHGCGKEAAVAFASDRCCSGHECQVATRSDRSGERAKMACVQADLTPCQCQGSILPAAFVGSAERIPASAEWVLG